MTSRPPTDDERAQQFVTDADLDRFEAIATPMYQSTREAAGASKYLVSDLCQWIVRLVAEVRRLRRSEGPSVECPQCAGPHQDEWLMAYGGHWDTCPNRLVVEPQGEPSDAQVEAVKDGVSRLAGLQLMRRYSSFGDPWWDALYAGIAHVAIRVIGGTR